ncbi:MAG: hypothetical protein VYE77_03310 [Planctomycetota bacterium]|nr:hypothetical protein [Planctomycetota bacterium]
MSNRPLPRACRILLLVVTAATLAACHFHGSGHCRGPFVPVVRVCR